MADGLAIPADIFEEMAGMKEILPPSNKVKEENVQSEKKITNFDETRLKKAAKAFISKPQKQLASSFYKVAKYIQSLQKADAPKVRKPRKIEVTIINKESAAEAEARENTKKSSIWRKAIKVAWKAFKFLLKKIVKFVFKHVFKVAAKAIKFLFKLVKKFAKVFAKVFVKTLKAVIKLLLKLVKFVYKSIKVLIKVIWRIITKLFLRGKPMKKVFSSEPPPLSMKQPTLNAHENKMKLKMKAPAKKSTFIFKAVKKIFNVFAKLLWKIISKVFGKIINKVLNVIVKMIVKFVMGQVIGSLLPGIGNLIMGAASMALFVYDIMGIVSFVNEVSNQVSELSKDFGADPEEDDEDDEDVEDDEENEVDNMDLSQVQAYMKKLEENNQAQTEEYFQAKGRYLELLSEEYRKSGDNETADIIAAAMETGEINANAAETIANGSVNPGDGIKKLDLSKLQQVLLERQRNKSAKKYENKAKNVFDESEIEALLTGEVDKGPMWISIWREFMWFIKGKIPLRLDKQLYINICSEIVSPHIKPQHYVFNIEPKWWFETQEQRYDRVSAGETKILDEENEGVWNRPNKHDFSPQAKFNEVISIVDTYKFDINKDTEDYQESKQVENFVQKEKLFKWMDILDEVSVRHKRIDEHDIPLLGRMLFQ